MGRQAAIYLAAQAAKYLQEPLQKAGEYAEEINRQAGDYLSEKINDLNNAMAKDEATPQEGDIDKDTDLRDTTQWPDPPIEGNWEEGPPSRSKARNRGEKSLYNENGDEIRPHKPDNHHHEGHWDYKPHGNNAEWENYTIDGNKISKD